MKDKISKLKLKNSEKIANAFLENNDKFLNISNIYKKHKTLCSDKDKVMKDIIKLYFLVFKGLSSRRKSVTTLKNRSYSISRKGIVRKIGKYGSNYDDILNRLPDMELNQELVLIGENAKEFKKVLKNPRKKEIFNKFFNDYTLLRNEEKIIMEIKLSKQIVDIKSGFYENPFQKFQIDTITLDKSGRTTRGEEEYEVNMWNRKQMVITIAFSKMYYTSGVVEKIYIEQLFTYIKELIEKEIKSREKEIKRLKLFYSKIKTRFGDYLMLEVIEKDNN